MTLIHLTREFDNGSLEFDGLPNLDHGFVRILTTVRIDSFGRHELLLEMTGTGPHIYLTDPLAHAQNPVNEGPAIILGVSDAEGNAASIFNSEILFGLLPGSGYLGMQAYTSNAKILPGAGGGAFGLAQLHVSGGRLGPALTSVKLTVASSAVSGIARLFWHEHISDLRAEI